MASKEQIEQMFSQENHDLSQQIVNLLTDKKGSDIFAILAFAATYAIICADERGVGNRTKTRDFYVRLIDTFLAASPKEDSNDGDPTAPHIH